MAKVRKGISSFMESREFPTAVSHLNVDMGKLSKLPIFLNKQAKVGQTHLILDFCFHSPIYFFVLILSPLVFEL